MTRAVHRIVRPVLSSPLSMLAKLVAKLLVEVSLRTAASNTSQQSLSSLSVTKPAHATTDCSVLVSTPAPSFLIMI